MIITTIRDVRYENINWMSLGKRFKKYRKACCMSHLDAAQEIGVTESSVIHIEDGSYDRKSTNIIWSISFKWDLSVNWLLNGLGKPHDPDPVNLIPETLYVQKGAGIRKSCDRLKAEEGSYTDHVLEFVTAIDKFKSKHSTPFPALTQIYEIFIALGYRKSVPARIAPLGYIIEHQQWAEKLKQINEVIRKGEMTETKLQKAIAKKEEQKSLIKKSSPSPKFLLDSTLSKKERSRRKRISEIHRGKTKIKRYLITDPEGRQYTTERGLNDFCREHGLSSRNMGAVANGRRKHCVGWKIQHIPDLS